MRERFGERKRKPFDHELRPWWSAAPGGRKTRPAAGLHLPARTARRGEGPPYVRRGWNSRRAIAARPDRLGAAGERVLAADPTGFAANIAAAFFGCLRGLGGGCGLSAAPQPADPQGPDDPSPDAGPGCGAHPLGE